MKTLLLAKTWTDLGGAVTSQVPAAGGLAEVVLPIIVGLFFWAGFFLCNPKLRALVPGREDFGN